jgi:pimeloyl-ACP methyl ester carboxylesterase
MMADTLQWHSIDSTGALLGIKRYGSGACAVCIVHGFRSWYRWGFIPLVAQFFASRQFAAYVVSLPSSGYGPDGFSAERFAQATISTDRIALRTALDMIATRADCIAGLGHSRGGLLLLLEHKQLNCLALWTPPRNFGRWGPHQRHIWKSQGSLPVGTHPESNLPLVLSRTYLDDLERNHFTDQLEQALAECRIPTLVIAAEQDMVAPVADARALYQQLGCTERKLHVIRATGHTLGIQHPAQGPTTALSEALEQTYAWVDVRCRPNSIFAAATSPSQSSQ